MSGVNLCRTAIKTIREAEQGNAIGARHGNLEGFRVEGSVIFDESDEPAKIIADRFRDFDGCVCGQEL